VTQFNHRKEAIAEVDAKIREIIPQTGYKLETMPGIDISTASHIISEVGYINRFANTDKFAKF
jgi:transposase